MKNHNIWFKIFKVGIIAILCTALLVGCAGPVIKDDDKPSKPSGTTSKVDKDDAATDDSDINSDEENTDDEEDYEPDGEGYYDESADSDEEYDDSNEEYDDSNEEYDDSNEEYNNSDDTSDKTNSEQTNSTQQQPSKPADDGFYVTTANGTVRTQKEFRIEIPDYNPGVPGYDTKYNFIPYFNDKMIAADEVVCSADIDGIKFDGTKIIIPEAVNNANKGMKLKFVYKADKRYYYEVSVRFKHWEATFTDEFDVYNTEVWGDHEVGVERVNNPAALNMYNSAYVENGNLVLEAKRLDEPYVHNGKEYHYINTMISTKGTFSQRMGCFTSRIKMPTEGSTLSGFWMMAGGYGENMFSKQHTDGSMIRCSEMDIVETVQGNEAFGYTEHYCDPDGNYITGRTIADTFAKYPLGEYHDYTVVWTENATYKYCDGVFCGKYTDITPGDAEAFVIYSIFTAPPAGYDAPHYDGGYNGWVDPNDEDYYVRMDVDWLRVYK